MSGATGLQTGRYAVITTRKSWIMDHAGGHGPRGSWVSRLMGQIGHGSQNVSSDSFTRAMSIVRTVRIVNFLRDR